MRALTIIFAAVLTSGCTIGNWNSIEREVPLEPGTGVMVDIKQRGVFVLDSSGKPVACAEPSPDALSAAAASISGSASVGDKFAGSIAAALSENAAYVGLRTQTIQLLRDGMYRLCEGYMNGALSRPEFKMRLRQYQADMIALLAIEQLTGTVRGPAVILNTASGAGAARDITEAIALRDAKLTALRQDQEALSKVEEEMKPPPAAAPARPASEEKKEESESGKDGPADKDALKEKAAALSEKIELEQQDVDALNKQIQAAGTLSASASGSGNVYVVPPGGVSGARDEALDDITDAVTRIARDIITADHSTERCFENFREEKERGEKVTPEIRTFCEGVFAAVVKKVHFEATTRGMCVNEASRLLAAGKKKAAKVLLESELCVRAARA